MKSEVGRGSRCHLAAYVDAPQHPASTYVSTLYAVPWQAKPLHAARRDGYQELESKHKPATVRSLPHASLPGTGITAVSAQTVAANQVKAYRHGVLCDARMAGGASECRPAAAAGIHMHLHIC